LILVSRTPLNGTLAILLLAYIACFLPFATRNIAATLMTVEPELEQMARASGASWRQTMRHIVLPLLRPSLIMTWLILFAIFIRELGATILLYSQHSETISVVLVAMSDRDPGYAAALAVVQLVLLLIAFAMSRLSRAPLIEWPA
jgi:iron(III) transport system permease protein